ncbi:protein IQ-DOMAIN 14-like [Abrus precatorius]|uniref:Protein IQ-DOMAIN 14-like n=1 Tax=Abrus precatorius TaxID=3816 RepID=A0A8B8M039_ABRPR|nr:protein IQ-DOMAIN 14-like [Abrus precatorius]
MGKASKWFRGILGLKRPDSPSPSVSLPKPPKEKRRWSFVKSYREKDHATVQHHSVEPAEPHDHSVAVAAATAAIAEAAVAAAHAAAAVARLTSSGRCAASTAGGIVRSEEWAAIKIQSAFRGSLARKALRALKGLVKLQALVRGDIDRKRTAEWLHRVQAHLRIQARLRASRAQNLLSPYWNAKSSSIAYLHGPATPDKFESPIRSENMTYDHSSSVFKRNSSKSREQISGNQEKYGNRSDSRVDEQPWNQRRSWTRTCNMDEERSVRILEVDSGKPHITSKRRNLFYYPSQALVSDHYSQSLTHTKDSTVSYQTGHSQSSCEVESYSPLNMNEVEESSFSAAENSPQILSASSKDGSAKRSPFTPTRSDGSRSYLSGYSEYPSYMAYTESSKAKVRSLSAPKQRPQYERCSSSNRYSLHAFGESKLATQGVSALHASFTSKAYPGSGRLDKLGLPVGYRY